MTVPYRNRRLQEAYERGVEDGRKRKRGKDGDEPKVLTRKQVLAMSQDQINARWPEVTQSLAAGLPTGDDDDE